MSEKFVLEISPKNYHMLKAYCEGTGLGFDQALTGIMMAASSFQAYAISLGGSMSGFLDLLVATGPSDIVSTARFEDEN